MWQGFRNFLLRGNVIDLAVAVIIGAAFNSVVDGFIVAFVDPLLAIILGSAGEDLALIQLGVFPVGVFLSAVVTFILKAAVIYFVIVRPFSALAARAAAVPPPPAPTPADVVLLTEIRDLQKQQLEALKR
ncbi:MAG: large conductance mechanosensitive channel protein MscL [Chloroflexia bacterium]|jgi:large conductance mechanosensitive channel|nr:large conductance mechanosensitive channel protein MscL [Chloroflexia bacterium]